MKINPSFSGIMYFRPTKEDQKLKEKICSEQNENGTPCGRFENNAGEVLITTGLDRGLSEKQMQQRLYRVTGRGSHTYTPQPILDNPIYQKLKNVEHG